MSQALPKSSTLRILRALRGERGCESRFSANTFGAACLAILFGLPVLLCHGQQGATTPPATVTNAPAVSPENPRDPFWPPEYVRPMLPGEKADSAAAATIGEAEWRTMEKRLRETVHGVFHLSGQDARDEYRALIGDREVGVGELVSLSANGKTYRWKVASMTMQGGPVFERVLAASPVAPHH